jgi:hypothetical protein
MKTRALLLVLLASMSALAGCAAMRSLESDVSTYSQWPADRKPSTYAFERLPSQQARAEQQQALEDAARPAVEAAGFTPAPDRSSADVTVQLGARITATDRSPFADPFWWGAGPYGPFPYRHGGRLFMGPGLRFGWGPHMDDYRYLREVAVLIRDRKTGQPLYEASTVNDGLAPMADTALPAMFEAALKDFPLSGANPRRVTVEVKS